MPSPLAAPATRIGAIAFNTYREAVRARLLLGVFALALVTAGYSLVIATLSLGNEPRVVADLGALAMSFYGVVIAIVLGSTSLHRELEYKTIFPILSRPIRRAEYLLGKYFGTVLTVAVFIAVEMSAILAMLALEAGEQGWRVGAFVLGGLGTLGLALWRARPQARVFVIIPWALAMAAVAWGLASAAPDERRLGTAAASLGVSEIAIVAAVATLFASFSSPFLTAAFTAMVFVIGRCADSLAHIPKHLLGTQVSAVGRAIARVVPNLHVYVPPRPLLLGQVADQPVWPYVGWAAIHAAFYATVLLVVGSMAFQRRDFS
jgi:hypothetical protein